MLTPWLAMKHHSSQLLLTTSNIALCVLLFSCATLPRGLSPSANQSVAMSTKYGTSQEPNVELVSSIQQLFQSPSLNQHIQQALRDNPELKTTKARLEEAGFQVNKVKAPALPQLNSSISTGRQRANQQSNSSFQLGLDARWEPDVWGKMELAARASEANQDQLKANFLSAQQSLAAQVAQSWIQLISREKLLQLANKRLISLKKTEALIQRRFENGLESLGNLNLAQTDVASASAGVAFRTDQRDAASRSLQVLLGAYPNNRSRSSHWPSLQRSIKAGLPSSLLLRRPDIRAAYHALREADARVQVSYRDLFPSFPLTASIGQSSSQLKQLANSNFSTWSLLANLSAPIIDGGLRRAELGAANKRAEQALYNYQSTVLKALGEVENALGSEKWLKQRQYHTEKALKAAINAETNTKRSYENGLVEVLTLLDATRRRLSTEENLIEIQASRYDNRIVLALALGKAL